MMLLCGLDKETGAIRGDIQKAVGEEGVLQITVSGPDEQGRVAAGVIPSEDAQEKICP